MTALPAARRPVTEPFLDPRRAAGLARARRLARLLDASFRVPGTRFRFGLDSVVGLVPGIGDAAGGLVSAWLLLEAKRLGVDRGTLLRMLGNVLVDLAVGTVPIAGDAFDAVFKANLRNVKLLEDALAGRR